MRVFDNFDKKTTSLMAYIENDLEENCPYSGVEEEALQNSRQTIRKLSEVIEVLVERGILNLEDIGYANLDIVDEDDIV